MNSNSKGGFSPMPNHTFRRSVACIRLVVMALYGDTYSRRRLIPSSSIVMASLVEGM